MSRFAHHNPEDPEGAMDALVDRADFAKTQQREAAFGSFEWAKQIAAQPPQLSPVDHLTLAHAQTQVALGCLSGGPNIGVAIICLEEALDHARKARVP